MRAAVMFVRMIAPGLMALAICWPGWGSVRAATDAKEAAPPTHVVRSPDDTIEVSISASGALAYWVHVDGQPVVSPSRLGLKLRGGATLGRNVEIVNAMHRGRDATWENPFGKRRLVIDQHNQLNLLLRDLSAEGRMFEIAFRVSNDGVAFRYKILSQPGMRNFVLNGELTEFCFPDDFVCYAGEQEGGFAGPQDWEFSRRRLSDIKVDAIVGLPLLVETPAAWLAITEADRLDWAGMWIGGRDVAAATSAQAPSDATSLEAVPATLPVTLVARLAPRLDGDGLVKANTPRHSPWRVLMIGRDTARLIESELLRNLSTPSKLEDTSWIKPGMVAGMPGTTSGAIIDTETMKKHIQLAADMGWPYQLLDGGWYREPSTPEADITTAVETLDMEEIRRFAEEKGVRLWLGLHWADLDRDDAYKKAFPQYHDWGIAGVQIEFVDRNDQEMVRWHAKITRAAAEHQLMVNFDGASGRFGSERTFPNQIVQGRVFGNEYAAGTRAAELARLIVYDHPLCRVGDDPERYRAQPGADFLRRLPGVWDDTRVLDGAAGEHVVMVRQSGEDWFLGALTSGAPCELSVALDFLGPGRWKMRLWKDGAEIEANADHLATEERTVDAGDGIRLRLAPAGGCVAHFQQL